MVTGLGVDQSGAEMMARGVSWSGGATRVRDGGVGFGSILRKAHGSEDPRERAREAAEEFVAQSLVLPILKSIRDQNQAAPPFGPGPYEKNIASLFDIEIASRMVRSQRFEIVDAVARNLLRESRFSALEASGNEQGGSDGGTIGPSSGGSGEDGSARRVG
ncbi:MAG: hypothetical protein JNK58_09810 [Phycisphaerae bacterium]|nr:hypothetical protein [Phycisphaerae bacterium]